MDVLRIVVAVASMGGVLLFLWVILFRCGIGRKSLLVHLVGLVPGVGLVLLAGLPTSDAVEQMLAGLGVALIGIHWLVFRENWIRFNQVWSGGLMKWHRSYANSRLVVLLVGTSALIAGLVATTSSFTMR